MVTTTFVRDVGLEVRRPRAAQAQRLDARSLRVSVTMNGSVYIDGERLELSALRERVSRFIEREGSSAVIIVPDQKTTAGRLVEVMDAAKAAGATDIAVATREKEA